jgi:hypothetical protein
MDYLFNWSTPSPQAVYVVVTSAQTWVAWLQAGASMVAALAALFALWSAFMPWCDLVDVKVIDDPEGTDPPTGIKLVAKVRNAGRGQALAAWVELLEFGGLSDPRNWDNYVGPVGPQTTIDQPFQTLRLHGTPEGRRFRVRLRWKALFGVHGEAYVEEGYGTQPSRRPRIQVLYPHKRFWRWITRYDARGRTPPLGLKMRAP